MGKRTQISCTKRLVNTSCMLTPEQLTGLHQLIRLKRFPSRSEAIRIAVRDLLNRELLGISLEHEELRKYVIDLHKNDPQIIEITEELVAEICGPQFAKLATQIEELTAKVEEMRK